MAEQWAFRKSWHALYTARGLFRQSNGNTEIMPKTIVIDILCFSENIVKSSVYPFYGKDSRTQQWEYFTRETLKAWSSFRLYHLPTKKQLAL